MKASKKKVTEFEITEQNYKEMIAQGADPEYALKPGKYQGRRGGFLERHPEFKAQVQQAKVLKKAAKVRVNIMLDEDIIEFFKAQSQSPNAAKYQTQINNVLRKFIDGAITDQEGLLRNRDFIKQVAVEVKALMK